MHIDILVNIIMASVIYLIAGGLLFYGYVYSGFLKKSPLWEKIFAFTVLVFLWIPFVVIIILVEFVLTHLRLIKTLIKNKTFRKILAILIIIALWTAVFILES